MTYYFWLGIEAEAFEANEMLEAYGYIEDDGHITVYPKLA
jgi:hypothetical protein